MRSFLAFLPFALTAVHADWEIVPTPERVAHLEIPRYVPEITTVETNKSYVVKLDCLGCPFSTRQADAGVVWQSDIPNALVRLHDLYLVKVQYLYLPVAQRLKFTIEKSTESDYALALNGRRILPLDSMPLNIQTWQVPSNLTTDALDTFLLEPPVEAVTIPMAFEHTALYTEKGGQLWIQFDVLGLPVQNVASDQDKEAQKLVQILLHEDKETKELSIQEIQVVTRQDRAQPYRMKCGNLAAVKTRYDPSQWDEYGKFGSWSRTFHVTSAFFDVNRNPIVLPLALMLAFGIIIARRWCQQNRQEKNFVYDDESEVALLDSDYEDSPPAYANIPMIKIEEYD